MPPFKIFDNFFSLGTNGKRATKLTEYKLLCNPFLYIFSEMHRGIIKYVFFLIIHILLLNND